MLRWKCLKNTNVISYVKKSTRNTAQALSCNKDSDDLSVVTLILPDIELDTDLCPAVKCFALGQKTLLIFLVSFLVAVRGSLRGRPVSNLYSYVDTVDQLSALFFQLKCSAWNDLVEKKLSLLNNKRVIRWPCFGAVLLILASQRIESIVNLGTGGEDNAKKITREVRGAPPTSIEWMILAYVAGKSTIVWITTIETWRLLFFRWRCLHNWRILWCRVWTKMRDTSYKLPCPFWRCLINVNI